MTEPIESTRVHWHLVRPEDGEAPTIGPVVERHRVHWYLVRPEDGEVPTSGAPEGHIFCDAPADAPCKKAGSWEDKLDLGGKPLGQDECWATVWIEATGIWHLWMGSETHAVDEGSQAVVWWDGGDWVWAYEGERVTALTRAWVQ